MQKLTLIRPDDWHLHLRDGDAHAGGAAGHGAPFRPRHRHAQPQAAGDHRRAGARPIASASSRRCRQECAFRAADDAVSDRQHARPRKLTLAKASGLVHAVKLYPAGATTNSDAGVTDLLGKCSAALARMEKLDLPLLVHGEVTDPAVDVFDRETVFIDTRAAAAAAAISRPAAWCWSTSPPGTAWSSSRRHRARCRHAHRASSAAEPQCHVRRRHPPASLLPAGAEARGASPGAGRGGDQRQPEILSRHR